MLLENLKTDLALSTGITDNRKCCWKYWCPLCGMLNRDFETDQIPVTLSEPLHPVMAMINSHALSSLPLDFIVL